MKKFITLSLAFLATYPNLSFSAEIHDHEEKTKKECSHINFSTIKSFISQNKYKLGISTAITTAAYRLLLKNRRLAALTTTATGLTTFGIIYYAYQGYLNAQLKQAIQSNNDKLIKKLIDQGADVNAPVIDNNGRSSYPLVEASKVNYHLIQLLLDNGANEDLIDNSTTKQFYLNNKQDLINLELLHAIQDKNFDLVKDCINKNACLLEFKINDQPHKPMVIATSSSIEIIKFILEKIAPKDLIIGTTDQRNYTQLMRFYLATEPIPNPGSQEQQKEQTIIKSTSTEEASKEKEESPKEENV